MLSFYSQYNSNYRTKWKS